MISSHGNDEEEGVTPPLTRFNSKHLNRRVSLVVGNYLSDLQSSRRIKLLDPNSTSEKDLECLIDQVMDSYMDDNGNVLPREIIRDALLSNMEKFKQQAENSHLTKEVSYHNSFLLCCIELLTQVSPITSTQIKRNEVTARKRSMKYNIFIFLRELFVVHVCHLISSFTN